MLKESNGKQINFPVAPHRQRQQIITANYLPVYFEQEGKKLNTALFLLALGVRVQRRRWPYDARYIGSTISSGTIYNKKQT